MLSHADISEGFAATRSTRGDQATIWRMGGTNRGVKIVYQKSDVVTFFISFLVQ